MSNNDSKSPDTKGVLRRAKSNTGIEFRPYPQKSHSCPIPSCGRLFKRLEHLRRHVRIHTQERPYICNHCNKAFTRSDNLAQHRCTHDRDPTSGNTESYFGSCEEDPESEEDQLQKIEDVSETSEHGSYMQQYTSLTGMPPPVHAPSANPTDVGSRETAEREAEAYMGRLIDLSQSPPAGSIFSHLFSSSATPAKQPGFSGFGPPAQPSTSKADEKLPTFSWGMPKEGSKQAEEALNALYYDDFRDAVSAATPRYDDYPDSWGPLEEESNKVEEARNTRLYNDLKNAISAATPWYDDYLYSANTYYNSANPYQVTLDQSGYDSWPPLHPSTVNPPWAPPSPTPRCSTPITLKTIGLDSLQPANNPSPPPHNSPSPEPESVGAHCSPVREPPAWRLNYKIGTGACGTVFLEIVHLPGMESPELWAVKMIPRALPNFTFKRYQAEIKNLQALARHEWFVKFNSTYEDTHYMYIAMEYIPMGDMSQSFTDGYRWNESDTKVVIRQLLYGLAIMHKEGITHRDLKPENIFLYLPENQTHVVRAKIGDFGTSKRIPHSNASTYLKTTTGTQGYMAPEAHDTSQPKTNRVDIWSLGCILYRMFAGNLLFNDPVQVWKYAASPSLLVLDNIGLTSPCVSFLCDVLQPIPEDRPSAENCLKDAWIMSEVPTPEHSIGEDLYTRLCKISHRAPNVHSFPNMVANRAVESSSVS